jgi:putative SOS response-associated peptidase YedK
MGHIPNKRKAEARRLGVNISRMAPEQPGREIATIADMLASDSPNWAWAHCNGALCHHHAAVTFMQFAIRWGLDADAELVRERLVCSRCGRRGAHLTMPSMAGVGGMGGRTPYPDRDRQAMPGYRGGMCNLYAMTKGPAAIREATRAMRDTTGNLEPLPAIFPDYVAPVVRTGADGVRELVMMRWGFPPPSIPGSKPRNPYLTNVRNTDSRYWGKWLKDPASRCLVPATSFAEPDNNQGPKSIWTWFARDESRPLMFFAGIWREWEGDRGTKAAPLPGKHLVFSFLTTDASHDVAPVHSDATPVLLLDEDARERWMLAPWEEAGDLQVPPPPGALKIVAAGEKQDVQV